MLGQGRVADNEAIADGSAAVVAAADGEELDGLLRRAQGQLVGGGASAGSSSNTRNPAEIPTGVAVGARSASIARSLSRRAR